MKLSQIIAIPSLLQLRETHYSESTVKGILAEGIDLAKWSDIPVVSTNEIPGAGTDIIPADVYAVGGDGNSRFAAVKALAAAGRLPEVWRDGDDFDIPVKVVSWEDCERLMLANLCREDLSPAAEARGFEMMKARGLSEETIAVRSHKSGDYVRRMMKLNGLAACIRERIGKPSDAGGIDKTCALVLADEFRKYEIGVAQQQELYNKVLAHSDLTPNFIRGFLKKIAPNLKARADENALFILPPSIESAVKETQNRAKELRKILSVLTALINTVDSEVFGSMPELRAAIKTHGPGAVTQLAYEADSDAAVIGKMVLVA